MEFEDILYEIRNGVAWITNNIANAQTTRTEKGGAYQRQDVVFTADEQNSFLPKLVAARRSQEGGLQGGVKVAGYKVKITDINRVMI